MNRRRNIFEMFWIKWILIFAFLYYIGGNDTFYNYIFGPVPGKDMQTPLSHRSGHIYKKEIMKDKQCAEMNEKSIFLFHFLSYDWLYLQFSVTQKRKFFQKWQNLK